VITVAQLLVRRRVLAAWQAQRPRRRTLPAAAPPRAPLAAATAALVGVGREMDAAVLDELVREGVLPRGTTLRADGPADGSGGALALPILPTTRARIATALAQRLLGIVNGGVLVRTLDVIAAQVDAHAGAEFGKQLASVIGVDPGTLDYDTRMARARFRLENLDLITSLATAKVDRVQAILERHGAGGRVEQIQADIEAETGATPARAALIARDQVLKLNAEVTQVRHVNAGIREYVWRTSRDERVRKGHRDLEGKTFAYGDPPVVDERTGRRAAPGLDYRCRCTAEPIVPGLD
jgi:SPP1 gp7 family putative phage head morphogenesis protein